ncbi:sigma-70 family RNA polymerase sigma factor [Marinifilum fragile]|uniref:sigma-70 family RNA polymerase sigma factor n=1 Tax=Marinifilum fragile TaxID=570161 RepID=UPI002AABA38C|nr:sigma-70 family RNA polymerase sigma factor [Marinifilum fragile]
MHKPKKIASFEAPNSTMRTTDKYICKLLTADNKQGMNLLFKKYFESLVIWADTFLNDMDQSQDLVQDLFVGIWRKKTYHNWNPDKLASYLHVAVKNACFNKIKKVDILKNTADIESFDKIYDEFESNKEEIVAKILEEVEKLPAGGREVVKCIYLKGMKYQEAADELNVSLSTVKTQLVRSLKTLRASSENLGDFFLLYFFLKK